MLATVDELIAIPVIFAVSEIILSFFFVSFFTFYKLFGF